MASTIIAVCALVLSLFGIYATIRHNKLSVTPKLVRNTNRKRQDDGIIITFDLCNHGIGPAKIVRFDFFLDGKPFTAKWDPVEALLEAGLGDKISYKILSQGCPGRDYCLIVGQNYRLAEVFLPGAKQSDEQRLNEIFSRMNFRVEYESLYGVRYALDTRDQPTENDS